MSEHVIRRWLEGDVSNVGRHSLRLLSESDDTRKEVLEDFRDLVRSHYVDPVLTAKRFASLGAPKTAQLLREHLPLAKKARSGDIGKVLAIEIAEQSRFHMCYKVTVSQWSDHTAFDLPRLVFAFSST